MSPHRQFHRGVGTMTRRSVERGLNLTLAGARAPETQSPLADRIRSERGKRMTSEAGIRKALMVIVAMVALAGVWTLVVPFSVSVHEQSIICSSPVALISDSGDSDSDCQSDGLNRVSGGFMLLAVAGLGWMMTRATVDHWTSLEPDGPPTKREPGVDADNERGST